MLADFQGLFPAARMQDRIALFPQRPDDDFSDDFLIFSDQDRFGSSERFSSIG